MPMKTKRRRAPQVADADALQHDLRTLLTDVKSTDLGAAEFAERLEAIHRAHFGDDAGHSDLIAARRKSGVRHADYVLSIERHHALERLARALGLERESGLAAPDGH